SYSPILGYSSIFERVWPLRNVALLCLRPTSLTCGPESRAGLETLPARARDPRRISSPQSACVTLHCPRRSYSAAPSRPIVAAVASSRQTRRYTKSRRRLPPPRRRPQPRSASFRTSTSTSHPSVSLLTSLCCSHVPMIRSVRRSIARATVALAAARRSLVGRAL